ncbi:unnamed protein product, partial [marine sediment metagenome]
MIKKLKYLKMNPYNCLVIDGISLAVILNEN